MLLELLRICWGILSYSKGPADSVDFCRTSKSCSRASFLLCGPVLRLTGVLSGSEGVLPESRGFSGTFHVLQGSLWLGWVPRCCWVQAFPNLTAFVRAPRPVLPCPAGLHLRPLGSGQGLQGLLPLLCGPGGVCFPGGCEGACPPSRTRGGSRRFHGDGLAQPVTEQQSWNSRNS